MEYTRTFALIDLLVASQLAKNVNGPSMHLLVQSKLHLVNHVHLPRNLYSQTPPFTMRSKVSEPVSDWTV